MALWRIKRQEIYSTLDGLPGQVDIKCIMHDDDTGDEATEIVTLVRTTYVATPSILLAALVTAGYTPNDWGGV